jgi:peptidoglycan hydrolase-like protein with peptidoglycan-binding domain
MPPAPVDWTAMPIDELRARANADEIPAMEELARRLVQGTGVTKDQQAGAGWLLRAAQRGSAQSAFNVGVMYERGFVVERDSTKAIEWYRKAVDANLAMAKHNLALLLRDGKGAPRNGKEAVELLRSASRQGMVASMFTLGDIYERGDAAPKDQAVALAWFAITAEFERQTNKNGESPLAKTATQRAQALQRILLPGELERAQQFGQSEFKQIVEALQPPKPSAAPTEIASAPPPALPPMATDADPTGWPKTANDQVRVIQQALVELKLLRDKPDGEIGPVTRAAIRTFQRSATMRETGEPTKEVFAALLEAIARRDTMASPPPPKAEPPKAEPPKAEPAKPSPATATPDIVKPEPPPAPPTSADIARAAPKSDSEPASKPEPDANAWPEATADQVKVIQGLLRDLKFSRDAPDGLPGPATREAIREYERTMGLVQTGEPSKALFDSLKEMRDLTASKPK